jgi:capsid protein
LTEDEEFNEAVEQAFFAWAKRVKLGRKLWQMRYGWAQDGESFAMFKTNLALDHPVKLDLETFEPEQISDGVMFNAGINRTDGMVLDDFGNVSAYKVLPQHPGDARLLSSSLTPDLVPARDMIHLMRTKRARQLRGVPEITPALMIYPILRRYTLAMLYNAETSARVSGVIRSQQSPDDPDDLEPLDPVELGFNEWMTLPAGWNIEQFKSQQPNAEYAPFKKEVIREIARCMKMPYVIAAADSSGHNFASGKLDHTTYFKSVGIDQTSITDDAADPTFERWYQEAIRIPGYLPAPPSGDRSTPAHDWIYDGQELLDPREANAQAVAAGHGLDSIPRQHAKRGLRTDQVMRANAKALGITVEEYQKMLRSKYYDVPLAPDTADEASDNANDNG